MAKVYAPNKQFTGTSAGVAFYNGVGECDNPVSLEWFERHGYDVAPPEDGKGEDGKGEDGKGEDGKEPNSEAAQKPKR